MIYFLSGWTNPGGSTEAHIKLVNTLNSYGYDACLCGKESYPLNKCKFQLVTSSFNIYKEDSLVVHFKSNFTHRLPVKNFILSSHEQIVFPIKQINYKIFDKIHFVSDHQKVWHNINHPSFICGNVIDDIKPSNTFGVVGIIGSIDRNKLTHISIKRALNDGFKTILLFGLVTDPVYYDRFVKPFVDNKLAIYMGYCEDKQKMYDMISDIYISSDTETFSYIIIEGKKARKNIHTLPNKDYNNVNYELDNKKIVDIWIRELNL